MTKKDYVLTLLTKLESTRDMATPLKTLIESTPLDDAFIDGLAAMMMEAVHEVTDDIQREKLEASQKFLLSLQAQSQADQESADTELEAMLAAI